MNTMHVSTVVSSSRASLVLILLFAGPFASGAHAQPASAPAALAANASRRAQLFARVESRAIKSGEPITLKVTLKNVSSEPLEVMDTYALQDYETVLVDRAGREAKRTELGRRLVEGEKQAFRAILVLIKPSEEVRASIDLAILYEITQPGTYFVRVTRTILPGSEKSDSKTVEKVISNPVEFTVVE